MKVLHLPYNIGSKISLTVSSLRKIGVDAKGIAVNNSLDEAGEHVSVFNPRDYNMVDPRKFIVYLNAHRELEKQIAWADVVHWYFDFKVLRTERFVNRIRQLNKPAVVEWLGSDIRIPEVLSAHNPFYKKAFSGDYQYKFESLEHSREVQRKFRDAGFEALVRPDLEEFVQMDIFSSYYRINNRVGVSNFNPVFPDPGKKKPLIVHPVTSRGAKGTSHILAAIDKLKQRYDLDFLLLENLEHKALIDQLMRADVVIDQLILGAFGTLSLEGMALGKPVVCYLGEGLRTKLPGIPLADANPDTIYTSLEALVTNGEMRNETGKRSRKYVEENHDSDKIALELKKIYEEIIKKKSVRA